MKKNQLYFESLMENELETLRSTAYRILRRTSGIDVIIQKTMLLAWKRSGSFRNESKLFSYVYRVALNASYDLLLRRWKKQQKSEAHNTAQGSEPSSEIEEQLNRLNLAVASLPEKYRLVLALGCLSGLSAEKAAAMADCSVEKFQKLILKAKGMLKKEKDADAVLATLQQLNYPENGFSSADEFRNAFTRETAKIELKSKKASACRNCIIWGTVAASVAAVMGIFMYSTMFAPVEEIPGNSAEETSENGEAVPEVQVQKSECVAMPPPLPPPPPPPSDGEGESIACLRLPPVPAERRVYAGMAFAARSSSMKSCGCAVPTRKETVESGKNYRMQNFNTEEYKSYEDNPFLEVRTNPLSTFGADVDTASCTNLRRLLKRGGKPDRNAVRTEELLNYFSYDYAAPKDGEKFAVNFEMMDAPWNTKHKLLLIGVQAKKVDVEKLPPSNFVFLIDDSGSMSDSMELVRESMTALADTMRKQDTISLVTYGGGVKTLLQGIRGSDKDEIKKVIGSLDAGGYTPGGAGIQEAYKLAHKYFIPGGNNRIILITDGDFNVGTSSESELVSMVEKERQSAIYLTAIGVGEGNYKDNKLKMLANKGNGNYLYWDSAREARNSLLNEMTGSMFTLAKDVKFQLEMNPAKIHSYRQIGYEFRKLADRDFNDDTKDSGEVGIGQQVTVLYELVMADGENKSGVDPLKYQEVKNTGNTELLTCKMRYQEPEGNAASVKKTFVLNEMPKDGDNIHWAAVLKKRFCQILFVEFSVRCLMRPEGASSVTGFKERSDADSGEER